MAINRTYTLSAAEKARIQAAQVGERTPSAFVPGQQNLAVESRLGRRGEASLGVHDLQAEAASDPGRLNAAERDLGRPVDSVVGADVRVGF